MIEGRDVEKIVSVDFDSIVMMSGIDDFNEYLCTLTEEPDLQDISWRIVFLEDRTLVNVPNAGLMLMVRGYVEDE